MLQVKEEDEGEYQCATSTEPPAYSTITVLVDPQPTDPGEACFQNLYECIYR